MHGYQPWWLSNHPPWTWPHSILPPILEPALRVSYGCQSRLSRGCGWYFVSVGWHAPTPEENWVTGVIHCWWWYVITRSVRHRVLKWARFVFHIIYWGSTSGLMLIDLRAANMSSMSSGEERNVGEWCALLPLALWTVSYNDHITYRPTLNCIERFELGSLHSLFLYCSMGHK